MDKYGSDKPDLRFDMCLIDVKPLTDRSDFNAFKSVESVKGLIVPGGSKYSRKNIDELINKHYIFEKIEIPGSLPRAWVTTNFHLLTFSEKKTFMHLVYSYYYTKNPKYDYVRIFDNITGKSIGYYKPPTLKINY